MGIEPTKELFAAYQTSSKEIHKLEEDLEALKGLTESLEGKVNALKQFIALYETNYPEYLKQLPRDVNNLEQLKQLDRNAVLDISWGDRIRKILEASLRPLHVGEIVSFITESKWHKDEEKVDAIRRRVYSQLHYMTNAKHVLKSSDSNGNLYRLP